MVLQQAVKKVLFKVMPSAAASWQRTRRRRHQEKFESGLGMPRITKAFVEKHGLVVQNGPFKGMRYIAAATGSMYIPKLVGCYETEISGFLEDLIARNPSIVIDIGSAEGYYAVGLAKRLPEARIFAFDTDPLAQDLCQSLAQENGLEKQVSVRGSCEFDSFEVLLQESKKGGEVSALVICDCDGCEAFLLDPSRVPSLKESDVLVETHDHIEISITATLQKNFASTHDIATVPSGFREAETYPEVHFLSLEDQEKALSEFRPPQTWLIMTPKSRPILV